MKSWKILPLMLALSAPLSAKEPELGKISLASLSTSPDYKKEEASVRFSWKIKAEGRGQLQSSYRILVGKDKDTLKPDGELIWDSGKVEGFESIFMPYEGPALTPDTTYYWKVQLWNNQKEEGPWSAPASFSLPSEKSEPATISGTEAKSTGDFSCSDETLNQLFKAAIDSRKKALTPTPTFQPDGLPWGAPLQLTARGYAFQADLNDYYRSWLEGFVESAEEGGLLPSLAGTGENSKPAPGYSDAGLVVPFALWQLTGDKSLVELAFDPAVAHVGAIQKIDSDFSGKTFGIDRGDYGHKDDPTSSDFLAACVFSLDCRILSEMATAMEHLPYIMQHQVWFSKVREGFQKKYFVDGKLTEKSQTAQILALRYSLLPPEAKQPTADALATRLEKEGLKAGNLGTAAVLPVLSWTDHHEQAVSLAKSFGAEDAAPSAVALANTQEWMFAFLAGFIHQSPGFKSLRVSPFIPTDGSVTEVKAHHETPYGRLAIHWKTSEKGLSATVTVPPNTTGIIALPGEEKAKLTEGGLPLEKAVACQLMRFAQGRHEIIAQSGTYQFELVNP
ncbi:alpha-L-rhamnosidase C-terminal domain-containing protein [Roseibacillus persicicus]|uniref:alpha-L-rhamnosidase-related protein n=1 Tax=Roseibacillus persicicus TaxID=454148 RepID=UPI00398ADB99